MFAVIYKGYIYPETEEEYRKLWRQVAQYFIKHQGALGSCLHKTPEGEWVAYSRWPDQKTRDASWPREWDKDPETVPGEMKMIIASLKKCIDKDRPFQEICMEVKDDFL